MGNFIGYVYKIINNINGRIYIGQTVRNVNDRFAEHCRYNQRTKNMPIVNAINKYGRDNFSCETICTCFSRDELNERESFYIRYFDSSTKANGYNIASGGGNGYSCEYKTEAEKKEIFAKCSESLSKWWDSLSPEERETKIKMLSYYRDRYIKSITKEQRQRMAEVTRRRFSGRIIPPEVRSKISDAKKGVRISDEVVKRRAIDTEYNESIEYNYIPRIKDNPKRAGMSKKRIGELNPMYGVRGEGNPKSIAIICTDLRDGSEREIIGIQNAARILGLSATKICAILKGRRRRSTGGFTFRYAGSHGDDVQ